MTRSQLIFQRDRSVLITPGDGREYLASLIRLCAQLKRIVAGNYVFELSPIALWGAAARGTSADQLLAALDRQATTPIPKAFEAMVSELMSRYGAIKLESNDGFVRLRVRDRSVLSAISIDSFNIDSSGRIASEDIGRFKLAAARAGWPVADERRAARGRKVSIMQSSSLTLRPYQEFAVANFLSGTSGLILLPCGAGKTLVGVAIAARLARSTLVLTPSRTVAEQWRSTFLEATTVSPSDVGLVHQRQAQAPVTITTYHAATIGSVAGDLVDIPWGLVIYDEVQSLPADVFRLAAAVQTPRRLGLTATLVREDGREREIVALVGPPIYDAPWIELEQAGWIAPARCYEVRIPQPPDENEHIRFKLATLGRLMSMHPDDSMLVVASNLKLLRAAARQFHLPTVTGRTSQERRRDAYQQFRDGRTNVLALSKVGSVGIDLPGANVLVQLSGTFGSRQEEAQRLGRLLRPKHSKIARFYSLVVSGGSEERYARRRQRFLVDQGYEYELIDASNLPR